MRTAAFFMQNNIPMPVPNPDEPDAARKISHRIMRIFFVFYSGNLGNSGNSVQIFLAQPTGQVCTKIW